MKPKFLSEMKNNTKSTLYSGGKQKTVVNVRDLNTRDIPSSDN